MKLLNENNQPVFYHLIIKRTNDFQPIILLTHVQYFHAAFSEVIYLKHESSQNNRNLQNLSKKLEGPLV